MILYRLDQGHLVNLELQQRNGDFTNHFLGDIGGGSAWAMTMADVDHNGWKDVVADGRRNSNCENIRKFRYHFCTNRYFLPIQVSFCRMLHSVI